MFGPALPEEPKPQPAQNLKPMKRRRRPRTGLFWIGTWCLITATVISFAYVAFLARAVTIQRNAVAMYVQSREENRQLEQAFRERMIEYYDLFEKTGYEKEVMETDFIGNAHDELDVELATLNRTLEPPLPQDGLTLRDLMYALIEQKEDLKKELAQAQIDIEVTRAKYHSDLQDRSMELLIYRNRVDRLEQMLTDLQGQMEDNR